MGRRRRKRKGGREEGKKKGRCSLYCRNAPSGRYQKSQRLPWGSCSPWQLWETWAITLLKMNLDGKMSFDFFENLEGIILICNI